VLTLLGKGLTNAVIAERLGVSSKTVANYVSAVLTRLELPDRAAVQQQSRDVGR
jgi:DNA-binding NarL/FixJ family response regulator